MTTTNCPHCSLVTDASRLFCQVCGKVLDASVLRSIRLEPRFLGDASMSPKMQEFFGTGPRGGDPSIFDDPD